MLRDALRQTMPACGLLLTMPIFAPIITNLGFDPVWFGILFCSA